MSANYRDLPPEQIRAYHAEQDRRRQEFAEHLRLFLEHYGMNGYQLSVAMGVNRGVVYRWLRGERLPCEKYMCWLGEYFGWAYD